ncbi:unnamed protein product (macronuclear) [Paramecium tetraurelia]|uniref:Protein kinase domain-containing protein n=1 Tax=Paramecium tetraurelia TaxID=5888 RepID=A0DKD7_PARTE|nr:uncharacterized protein GSPATT00017833001 [Paramecium tetraurelia]CAK83504.1 unnamed protein product [Paramecium tetraurelia]|eukprot:XP_001450901.1 hypothetical protein (macronuclear) [Paramecium tetraurelia strain d4-2]
MNSSDYSIFEQYPTRMRSLWIQGQPTYSEIDRQLRQSPNDSPIYIKDQCDQLIARPQYQLVNQYLISTNCFVNISNLNLKSITHNEVQGLQLSGKNEFFQLFGEEHVIQKWKSYIAKYTIQRNFLKHYKILKLIGQGSHAKVYKIQKKQDSSIFAVKIFKKAKIVQKEKGASLVLEIDVMRKLDHENVIQLYEVFEDSEKVYLIIDHLRGGDLFKKVQNSLEDYSEHVVQNLMNNILNSLKYLHAKNIIHRDIKPENMIFRTKSNMIDIVIADFGLSDIYNENKIYLFQKCGTVGYVAPEVLKDQAYNHKVDIFSAGVILFVLLTGQMPFANYENSEELLMSNYFCRIDYDKFHNKNISEQAQSLVKLLLEENVSKRPTAEEALLHEWFTNPKTETFCNLPVNLVPQMCICKNQDNIIKSSTPLWGQKGSFCDSPLLQKQNQNEENQFESKYFKSLIQSQNDYFVIDDDFIEEDKTLSTMVPKYHMLIRQRSID